MQTEILSVLTAHAKKYPLMLPCDAVKLLYQNEFGGGHLVQDEKQSLARMKIRFETRDLHILFRFLWKKLISQREITMVFHFRQANTMPFALKSETQPEKIGGVLCFHRFAL